MSLLNYLDGTILLGELDGKYDDTQWINDFLYSQLVEWDFPGVGEMTDLHMRSFLSNDNPDEVKIL